MTPTYLPSLEPAVQRKEKIRKRVRAVSIQQYAEGRARFTGRKADVLRWLAWYRNLTQKWPTAAELARTVTEEGDGRPARYEGPREFALHIRRGISDLLEAGLVQSAGERKCDVTRQRVESWCVIEAGRQERGPRP